MTVLLVLAMFLAFIALDYALNHRKQAPAVAVPEPRPSRVRAAMRYIEGFLAPDNVRYHPGHTWLARERKNLVRVGADEFAAVLAGQTIHVPDAQSCPKTSTGAWPKGGARRGRPRC